MLGPTLEAGGSGAASQLWWAMPDARTAPPVTGCSVALEVLQPPVLGRRCSWGLQAGVIDHSGVRVGEAVMALVHDVDGSWSWSGADQRQPLDRIGEPFDLALSVATGMVQVSGRSGGSLQAWEASGGPGAALMDVAVWMDLDQPPEGLAIVARWSALRCTLADGTVTAPETVLVTFPTAAEWRRMDVVTDDVGLLQVASTKRTAANMAVLAVPPGR